MEREQIIKALECCGAYKCGHPCQECPYFTTNDDEICSNRMAQDALALIKELTVELDAMRGAANSYKVHNEKLTEENERLKSVEFTCGFVKPHKVLECPIFDEIARTKADTVHKFAKRLEGYYKELSGKTFPPLVAYHIEQIEKEMLEDNT